MWTSTALLSTSSPQPYRRSSSLGAGKHGSGRFQQRQEQSELPRGQGQILVLVRRLVGDGVQREPAVNDQRLGAPGPATQQCPDAGRQLVQIERFHQVVVRARVQPADAVRDRVPGGEDQNRNRVAAASQVLQHLKAGFFRQPEIEQHQRIGFRLQRRFRLFPVMGPIHTGPVLAQPLADAFPDQWIVFDQQQSHSCPRPGPADSEGRKPLRSDDTGATP